MDQRAWTKGVRAHRCHHMLRRRGFTLVELIVALVLASLVLGIATTTTMRQQRLHSQIRSVADADAQLRAAMLILSAQLGMLDAGGGDLAAGEATDTALQFRAPVAISLSCALGIGAVTLHPDAAGEVPLGGDASLARTGDSLWWLGDSSWIGRRVTSVTPVIAACTSPVASTGHSLRLGIGAPDSIPSGTPLRVTRQTRYALYRASDGTWQLGFREWNDPASQFAAPQPVAGPLVVAIGNRRSGFRYFDAQGVEITATAGAVDVTRVARIRITAHSLVAGSRAGQDSIRTDSTDIALNHATGP